MFNNIESLLINDGNFHFHTDNGVRAGRGFKLLAGAISPSAPYDAGHAFDPPKCHPNTRTAVLHRIANWMFGRREVPVMWLYGAAGAGKSSIAWSIAEMCATKGLLLASFFFSRSDPSRNSIKHFIATLAFNITLSVPESRLLIDQAVERNPHIFSRSLDTQLLHLILNPLSQLTHSQTYRPPYVIIIDGLDECLKPEEQKVVIRLLNSILKNTTLGWKILVASRPEQAIQISFNAPPTSGVTTRIALSDDYDSNNDIQLFLEESLRKIKFHHPRNAFLPPDWPPNEAVVELVRKSSGQFVYAATVIKYLSSDYHYPNTRLQSILANSIGDLPFAELDLLYAHILTNAVGVDCQEIVRKTIALCILYHSYIKFGARERNPCEVLSIILGIGIKDVTLILAELSSIVQVTETSVKVYHASLGDFLFDRHRSYDLWVDEKLVLSNIACFHLQSLSTNGVWEYFIDLLATMGRARITERLVQCLRTFDIFAFLGNISTRFSVLYTCFMHFFEILKIGLSGTKEWEDLYKILITTFDSWLAWALENQCRKAPAFRAKVSLLAIDSDISRPISCFLPFQTWSDESFLFGVFDDEWFKGHSPPVFKENVFPKTQALILNGQIQASGVLHCIHFLVENALTDHVMRFVAHRKDKRKTSPWLWRTRRIHRPVSRLSCRLHVHKGRHCRASQLPFHTKLSWQSGIPLDWADHKDSTRGTLVATVISCVLQALPRLLDHATPSPQLVFALRVAASLDCNSTRFATQWRTTKKVITRYLTNEAGLQHSPRQSFVSASNVWRFHEGCQFQDEQSRINKEKCRPTMTLYLDKVGGLWFQDGRKFQGEQCRTEKERRNPIPLTSPSIESLEEAVVIENINSKELPSKKLMSSLRTFDLGCYSRALEGIQERLTDLNLSDASEVD